MSNDWFEAIKNDFIEKAKIHGSIAYHETELHTNGTGDVPHVVLKIRIDKTKGMVSNGKEKEV